MKHLQEAAQGHTCLGLFGLVSRTFSKVLLLSSSFSQVEKLVIARWFQVHNLLCRWAPFASRGTASKAAILQHFQFLQFHRRLEIWPWPVKCGGRSSPPKVSKDPRPGLGEVRVGVSG